MLQQACYNVVQVVHNLVQLRQHYIDNDCEKGLQQ